MRFLDRIEYGARSPSCSILLWFVLLVVMPFASGDQAHAKPPARPCADFLGLVAHKPPHVVFTGCRLLPDQQGKPMRATYHVDGRYAASAEAFLIRAVGLRSLRRSCCQWDGPSSWFTDKQGRGFSITMTSDETMVARRDQWRLIRGFTITVDTFTEEI